MEYLGSGHCKLSVKLQDVLLLVGNTWLTQKHGDFTTEKIHEVGSGAHERG